MVVKFTEASHYTKRNSLARKAKRPGGHERRLHFGKCCKCMLLTKITRGVKRLDTMNVRFLIQVYLLVISFTNVSKLTNYISIKIIQWTLKTFNLTKSQYFNIHFVIE